MILALDVGFTNTGWVVFDGQSPIDCGVIATEKNEADLPKSKYRITDDNTGRCQRIANQLASVISKYAVKAIVAELPTGGSKSSSAATKMAMATAVVATVVELMNVRHIWTTPISGKKALCSNKGATKDEMMDAARAMFPDFKWPKTKTKFEHIADAIGSFLSAQKDLNILFGACTKEYKPKRIET